MEDTHTRLCYLSSVSAADDNAPWPPLRDVIDALVTGLKTGRFIEEALLAHRAQH
jgi:hypothetical protein